MWIPYTFDHYVKALSHIERLHSIQVKDSGRSSNRSAIEGGM